MLEAVGSAEQHTTRLTLLSAGEWILLPFLRPIATLEFSFPSFSPSPHSASLLSAHHHIAIPFFPPITALQFPSPASLACPTPIFSPTLPLFPFRSLCISHLAIPEPRIVCLPCLPPYPRPRAAPATTRPWPSSCGSARPRCRGARRAAPPPAPRAALEPYDPLYDPLSAPRLPSPSGPASAHSHANSTNPLNFLTLEFKE